jgi:hypothetical protein
LQFAPVTANQQKTSYAQLMLSANVDGIAPNDFGGNIARSGPSRISLYEVTRDSPEGIANRLYHDRYPSDTDWGRLAREHRERQNDEELASQLATDADRS